MAILHVANFHGMKQTIKPTGGLDPYGNVQAITAVSTPITQIENPYYTLVVRTQGGSTGYVGRDPAAPDKSCIMLDPLTGTPLATNNYSYQSTSGIFMSISEIYNLMIKAAIGDVYVFGFRYKRICLDETKVTGPAQSIVILHLNNNNPPQQIPQNTIGELYNNIPYSIEIKFKKTSNTTFDFEAFINKTRIGSAVSKAVATYVAGLDAASSMQLQFFLDDVTTKIVVSDIFISYDKVTDTVKTDLAGPLDVRHHLPSVSTGTDDWKVVDGSPLSNVKPDVAILDALSDNDVGLHPIKHTEMTLAMTDSSGTLGTFKFENIPDGDYLGYAIDLFVNQPQSQSGDLYTEVLEGVSTTPVITNTYKNITRVPGNFQQKNVIMQSKPVNQDNLHAVKLNVGSKKIIPV